jgi:hypothetical protein
MKTRNTELLPDRIIRIQQQLQVSQSERNRLATDHAALALKAVEGDLPAKQRHEELDLALTKCDKEIALLTTALHQAQQLHVEEQAAAREAERVAQEAERQRQLALAKTEHEEATAAAESALVKLVAALAALRAARSKRATLLGDSNLCRRERGAINRAACHVGLDEFLEVPRMPADQRLPLSQAELGLFGRAADAQSAA